MRGIEVVVLPINRRELRKMCQMPVRNVEDMAICPLNMEVIGLLAAGCVSTIRVENPSQSVNCIAIARDVITASKVNPLTVKDTDIGIVRKEIGVRERALFSATILEHVGSMSLK